MVPTVERPARIPEPQIQTLLHRRLERQIKTRRRLELAALQWANIESAIRDERRKLRSNRCSEQSSGDEITPPAPACHQVHDLYAATTMCDNCREGGDIVKRISALKKPRNRARAAVMRAYDTLRVLGGSE